MSNNRKSTSDYREQGLQGAELSSTHHENDRGTSNLPSTTPTARNRLIKNSSPVPPLPHTPTTVLPKGDATASPPSTKQDILTYLLKQGEATAHTIAHHLTITPQATRRHLKELEADGLVDHQTVQTGMGRPNHMYQLSQAGREQFPDRYEEFALSLLDTLAETVGKEQVGTILRKQWERKAQDYREFMGNGSLSDRIAILVELRRKEGFMAEWHPLDAADAATDAESGEGDDPTQERFIIAEYHCAISHIAESFPTVCGHELELFTAALQDCTVERTHWLVDAEHRCGYLIQPKP